MLEITPDVIRAAVAAYYRYVRQCIIAFEAPVHPQFDERSDILVICERRLIEIEVKVSLSDFRKDADKLKHRYMKEERYSFYPVSFFYFAVPENIANDITYNCEQLYPYAGVIRVKGITQDDVSFSRRGRVMCTEKMSLRDIAEIVRQQSGTIARLARDVALLKQKRLIEVPDIIQVNPFESEG